MSTFDAFDADRGQLPGLATALGTWRGRALVLQGTKDPFGLQWLRTSIKELHSAATTALAVTGAGHFPWVEHPDLVLDTLNKFTQ